MENIQRCIKLNKCHLALTENDRQPLLEYDVLVLGYHDLPSLLVQPLVVPVGIQLRQRPTDKRILKHVAQWRYFGKEDVNN